MPTINRQTITEGGLNPALTNADPGGDNFPNSGREFLYVENTDAASHDVTIGAQRQTINTAQYGTITKSDGGGAVPAGEFRLFGPFAPPVFNSAGKASIAYSDATGMKVAVLRVS